MGFSQGTEKQVFTNREAFLIQSKNNASMLGRRRFWEKVQCFRFWTLSQISHSLWPNPHHLIMKTCGIAMNRSQQISRRWRWMVTSREHGKTGDWERRGPSVFPISRCRRGAYLRPDSIMRLSSAPGWQPQGRRKSHLAKRTLLRAPNWQSCKGRIKKAQ
jgi:hypothetical protein